MTQLPHPTYDLLFADCSGRQIRLSGERYTHIIEHPEMFDQLDKIRNTVFQPTLVVATTADPSVHVYHRYYATTPVTSKYLLVAIKLVEDNSFVLTAFFSRRPKKGTIVWQA
jgi:hypothetical protein